MVTINKSISSKIPIWRLFVFRNRK